MTTRKKNKKKIIICCYKHFSCAKQWFLKQLQDHLIMQFYVFSYTLAAWRKSREKFISILSKNDGCRGWKDFMSGKKRDEQGKETLKREWGAEGSGGGWAVKNPRIKRVKFSFSFILFNLLLLNFVFQKSFFFPRSLFLFLAAERENGERKKERREANTGKIFKKWI